MPCKNCQIKPVYKTLTNVKLCKNCFIKYFENKVFKTISRYKLIKRGETIVVAVSGGKDSLTTLYLLSRYNKIKNLNCKIKGLCINEGIEGYREHTIKDLKEFSERYGIEIKYVSFKELTGKTLDEMVNILKKNRINLSPCNICGTYRRYLLNKYAKIMKADKIATGHNLDDEAQNILLNIFKNNYDILFRLGPITDKKGGELVQRIKPLYLVTEKEVKLYTILKGFQVKYTECPYSRGSFRDEISMMLNELEEKHKGIKNGIVKFYLKLKDDFEKRENEIDIMKRLMEKILDENKKISKVRELDFDNNSTSLLNDNENINRCKICGEPTQGEICNACKLSMMFKEIEKKKKNK